MTSVAVYTRTGLTLALTKTSRGRGNTFHPAFPPGLYPVRAKPKLRRVAGFSKGTLSRRGANHKEGEVSGRGTIFSLAILMAGGDRLPLDHAAPLSLTVSTPPGRNRSDSTPAAHPSESDKPPPPTRVGSLPYARAFSGTLQVA